MKIGIISDTHDHFDDIALAVDIFKQQGCAFVLHGGDFCSQRAFEMFQVEGFQFRYRVGNHDTQIPSQNLADEIKGNFKYFIIHDTYGRFEDGIILNTLVDLGYFDLIVYGHLHYMNIRQPDTNNKTLVVNPGGFYHADMYTFCIYDTEEHEVEVFFKFMGEFVSTLKFQVSENSFKPVVCSKAAAVEFLYAYAKHCRTYIHSYQDSGDQWMCKAFWDDIDK